MFDSICVHYNEIAIKGNNRYLFEDKLVSNINSILNIKKGGINKRYGVILINLAYIEEKDTSKIKEVLQRIPGIANFSFSVKAKNDFLDIKEKSDLLVKDLDFNTFKVIAKRSNKRFEMNSQEINEKLGEYILEKFKKKVDVHTPQVSLYVDVGEKETQVYVNKIYGVGGLPVGSTSKVICSLSGGIDSPVAGFMMMKRGCEVVFVHIYNNTLVKAEVREKIQKLVKQLTLFQGNSRLYVVPFADIQKEIIAYIPSTYRMIIYRRYMFKIMNHIAKAEKAKGIVTGDSLGQVASQTLENINCIYKASYLPILPPLIGMNKDEIIELSKKIGTYESSIIPYPDCCSFMNSDHPTTKAWFDDILNFEREINLKEEKLIEEAIASSEIFEYKYP